MFISLCPIFFCCLCVHKPMDEEDPAETASDDAGAYVDGVSDELAALVLGAVAPSTEAEELLNLDNELFAFGVVSGEIEC
eukprot:m.72806 g.72806  ORF g.72806 m.72806 type:complete len:80 (-) comp12343_c0_seq1:254-493(-)